MDFKLFISIFWYLIYLYIYFSKVFFLLFFPFLLVWILDVFLFKKKHVPLVLIKIFHMIPNSWHNRVCFICWASWFDTVYIAHCLLFRGGASSYLLVIYMLYSIQSCLHLVCVSFDHSCMNLLKKTLWNETH